MGVSFPGSIPPPRQNPYPNEPMYGNMTSDIGQGLRQTGDDLMQFDRTMDEKSVRQAKMADMIERRKQALAVQAAKEEFQRKDMEFKAAKEAQDIEDSKRNYDRGVKEYDTTNDRIQGEIDRKADLAKEEKANVATFNQKLFDAEKDGAVLGRTQVRQLARAAGLGEDWEKYAGDRPHKPSASVGTRAANLAAKTNLLPRLEAQLNELMENHNRKEGTDFNVSRLVVSMRGLDTKIQSLPAESEKRKALQRSYNAMFKKKEEIDEIKADLDIPMEDQSTQDVAAEYEAILKRIREKEAMLGGTGG